MEEPQRLEAHQFEPELLQPSLQRSEPSAVRPFQEEPLDCWALQEDQSEASQAEERACPDEEFQEGGCRGSGGAVELVLLEC